MVLAPNTVTLNCYTTKNIIMSKKVSQRRFPSMFCLSIIICYYSNLDNPGLLCKVGNFPAHYSFVWSGDWEIVIALD